MFVGLREKKRGETYKISTKCGDATNSELTEGPRSRSRRSMLASESKSFPASEAF